MKLSQISLALINPRLELVNEIQRCDQGPCKKLRKRTMGHCNRSTYLSGADFTKVNLNFEFLNSFPLLGGGDRRENLLPHTSPPLLSFILPPPPPPNSQKGHCIAYPRYRRFFLACDEEFRRPQADRSSEI